MAGTYSVRTSSGTAYLVCLDEPRHVIRLAADTAPAEDYADLDVATLRRDGEEIALIALGNLEVGRRGELVLDVRRDGIATYRQTTPVLSIVQLQDSRSVTGRDDIAAHFIDEGPSGCVCPMRSSRVE
jgi:hypothetical protein